MKEDVVFVFGITVGGGVLAALNNDYPAWMGITAGLMVFSFVFGIDLILRLLIPAYRRHRSKD